MILVDTSVWIDHLRAPDAHLSALLSTISVGTHPWVIGELACGNLKNRAAILGDLQFLPHLYLATDAEVLLFIEQNRLMGQGIGYIDMHILASAKLSGVNLWTRDKRLMRVASDLQISYLPPTGPGLPS
jgi:predicted nucleic acid-binding protein